MTTQPPLDLGIITLGAGAINMVQEMKLTLTATSLQSPMAAKSASRSGATRPSRRCPAANGYRAHAHTRASPMMATTANTAAITHQRTPPDPASVLRAHLRRARRFMGRRALRIAVKDVAGAGPSSRWPR